MNTRPFQLLLLIAILIISSSARESLAQETANGSLQPAAWDAGLKLREAQDLNADPHTVEIRLETRAAKVDIGGRLVDAWTYDGGIPGPLIRIKVGDRLIVHFTNNLPKATTVHWHGVRVPIAMDGVPGVSQPEVNPGETFTYDFVVPDAGLFWYHPHVDSAWQVGSGLYGALLVEEASPLLGVPDELVLVLSDIDVAEDGALTPATGGSTGMAFGREGNIALANGRNDPALLARSGAPQRWRIVNTAKSRYFMFALGTENTILRIGGDGGIEEYSVPLERLVIAPGERLDVVVTLHGKPGQEIEVVAAPFDRGYGTADYRNPDKLFRIVISTLPEVPERDLPQVQRSIEALNNNGATPVQFDINLTQDSATGSFEYNINGKPYWKATPLTAGIGETQLWTINNRTPWSHPIHLHGFFFQVVDEKGAPIHPLAWKDTVTVPFNSTLHLLVRFDDRPGTWMVHCHILDHAEGGLMTTVQVGDGSLAGTHEHRKE